MPCWSNTRIDRGRSWWGLYLGNHTKFEYPNKKNVGKISRTIRTCAYTLHVARSFENSPTIQTTKYKGINIIFYVPHLLSKRKNARNEQLLLCLIGGATSMHTGVYFEHKAIRPKQSKNILGRIAFGNINPSLFPVNN